MRQLHGDVVDVLLFFAAHIRRTCVLYRVHMDMRTRRGSR